MSQPERLSAVQHIGVTVTDLERSIDWYTQVLGRSPTPVASNGGPRLARALGLGDDVELRYAFFELENVLFELVCYSAPDSRPNDRLVSDVGAVHVCFEVSDIEAAQERLRALGVEFASEPLDLVDGPMKGVRYVYFRDPDGVALQLLQPPSAQGRGPRSVSEKDFARGLAT